MQLIVKKKDFINIRSRLIFNSIFQIEIEGHKILQNLHQLFVLCIASQIIGGDFAKFCGLLRIYELYKINSHLSYTRLDF